MVNRNSDSGAAGGSNPIPPPSSAPQPPPPPPPPPSGTKRPIPPKADLKSGICPICHRNLYHEKALNGHIRWHTAEEREAAGIGIARSLAASVVVEEQDQAPKRVKVPDLNMPPPPDDDAEI